MKMKEGRSHALEAMETAIFPLLEAFGAITTILPGMVKGVGDAVRHEVEK
jgi:hypothetical protein